mgnify:CR=1 FL=1
MKTRFQHIASLILALLVLVSTQSFSINSHYCGNILVDKAVMKSAKKCAMHSKSSHKNHEQEQQKDDCCDDEVELIEGQDQLKVQSSEFELPHPIFVEAFVFSFLVQIPFEAHPKIDYFENPPPLPLKDFHALFQTYLI